MGRRKERRLAAMTAAGRRVKLDLFAEPSGDLGGSSIQDEVGGEDDSKNRAGLPNLPSSSGQRPQNPLLLLGQYSDDDLDEGSKGGNSDDADEPSGDAGEQAKVDTEEDDEGVGVNGTSDSVLQKVEQFILEMDSALPDSSEKLVEDDNIPKKAADSGYDHGDMDLMQQSACATSDKQVTADVSSGWKMVLHEESNQYYYWNVATGETSWEVPDALAQAANSAFENKAAADSGEQHDAVACTRRDGMATGFKVDNSISITPSDASNTANQNYITIENDGHGLEDDDSDQGKMQDSSFRIVKQHHEPPLPGVDVSFGPSGDALVDTGSAPIGDSVLCRVDMGPQGEYEAAPEFSSRLIKHCEHLLEQLKCGNSSKDEVMLKCTVEIEIRMNDIKSLASHGSFLFPFWVHSEKKLQQLEATINNVILQHHKDVQTSEIENAHKPDESIVGDNEAGLSEKSSACPLNGDTHAPVLSGMEVQKHVAIMGNETTYSASDSGGTGEVEELATRHELTPQTAIRSGEDVDMDVDMEVDDAVPLGAVPLDASDSQISLSVEQPKMQKLPGCQGSSVSEQTYNVPPPPDGDWIPPPPPDNEPYPPPPPEEPPETSYPPPPGSESVQTFSYTDQYNQSYPGSTFEYYGQTNAEVPSTTFYAYSEGFQAAASQPSVYYEAVPTVYGAAPVVVNPVEPGAYYAVQDGTVHPSSVGGGVESSGCGSVSGHKSFHPDTLRSLHAHSTAIPLQTKNDVPDVGGEMEKETLGTSSSQAPAAIPTAESVSVPSTLPAGTSAADKATATKGQSKVSRVKKRTVAVVSTLRSNKKVSSLVDKWKAVKEEMHEEEEVEPETYLEKLEKKRQREIEEWHAKQIASGEAKDNANFQPLGGDWRERVKRRRAQLMNEREQSPSDGVTEESQQPDLNELSKGLPSGWQAYWDESSKQVYYGNAVTSETSWIRPTN